jgi:hypothetical protein
MLFDIDPTQKRSKNSTLSVLSYALGQPTTTVTPDKVVVVARAFGRFADRGVLGVGSGDDFVVVGRLVLHRQRIQRYTNDKNDDDQINFTIYIRNLFRSLRHHTGDVFRDALCVRRMVGDHDLLVERLTVAADAVSVDEQRMKMYRAAYCNSSGQSQYINRFDETNKRTNERTNEQRTS